jgi:hypothetical protein
LRFRLSWGSLLLIDTLYNAKFATLVSVRFIAIIATIIVTTVAVVAIAVVM